MKLTVVRHGQTIENIKLIIQGQTDGTLSSLGIKQSNHLASDLSAKSFDVIISSDLGRCTVLAEKIHKYHPDTPLILSPALREICYGAYQGKPVSSLNIDDFPGTKLTQKVPDGESWMDLSKRIRLFLNETYEKYKNNSVLLVTHDRPIQMMRAYFDQAPLSGINDAPPTPNCGIRRWTMHRPVSQSDLKADI